MTTDHPAPPTSRRRFLRQAGGLLGLGTGALLLNTPPAGAAPPSIKYTCCRDETCGHCDGTPVRYRCRPTGRCGGNVYCTCASPDLAPCYDILCP